MPGNLVKRVMLKIVADDGDTEAKLDEISRKADELGAKHPELKVRVDSAAASAKLAVLRRELKDTAAAANQKHTFSLSGLVPAIGQMGMFQKVMLGVNVATTFAEPLLAGVVVAAGGLASGLTAAGAGLGVFGLVAKGVYSSVTQNIQTYTQAQYAAQHATTAAARTTALKQEQGAWNGLTASQREFAQGIVGAQNEWHSFVASNTSGVASIMHQGLGLLPGLLRDAQGFLPPVEGALHHIIGDLSTGLKSSQFQSFVHMLQGNAGPALEKLAGSVGHLFTGVGGIIKAFMPEAQRMLSGLDSGTAKFAHWGQTLSSHSGFQSLMTMFRTETPLAVHALGQLGGIVKTVAADMTGLSGPGNSKMLLQLANPVLALANALLKANPDLVRLGLYLLAASSGAKKLSSVFGGVFGKEGFVAQIKGAVTGVQNFAAGFGSAEKAAEEGTGAWGTWGGKISSVLSSAQSMVTGFAQKLGIMRAATEEETVAQEGLDVAMDSNPIGLIVIAIGALVVAFVELWKHSAAFRDFWKGLWHDIEHIAVGAWHFIDSGLIHPLETGIGAMVDWIKGHWQILATIIGTVLLGPIGGLVIFVATHWQQIKSLTGRLVSDVTGFFERLPGDIIHALGDLGSLLWNAGLSIMHGLLSGIETGWNDVKGFVSKVGGWISDLKGPLPKDRVLLYPHGQAIMGGLLGGLDSRMPDLIGQMARTTAAITTGVPHGGYGAGAAGTGGLTVEIHVPQGGAMLGPQFWSELAKGIRVKGGDPAILQRKVKFA